jgi:tRNA threonylcarbamoyladenosine biosynthesis protein TsaB
VSTVAIDTATEILSVGWESGGRYFETSISAGLRHSEYLLPALDGLTALAGSREPIELVVCMRGPGSFTGLRIGMATAKGLASGNHCPLVAVPTLDVLADGFDYFPGIVVPVIDARKQRVYAALYSSGTKKSGYLDITPGKLATSLPGDSPVLFTGPGSRIFTDLVASRSRWNIDPKSAASRARSLLSLGKSRLAKLGPDSADLGPVYLRRSEAEIGTET